MKIFASYIVNNDIIVNINLPPQNTIHDIAEQQIWEAYKKMKYSPSPVRRYTLLEVSGETQLHTVPHGEENPTIAKFNIQYVEGKINHWSFHYRKPNQQMEHVDSNTYTAEKLKTMLSFLQTHPNWDETFFDTFTHHVETINA